jgi:ABC-type dipeptide/oligopeptide/nickel transport system ATPase component
VLVTHGITYLPKTDHIIVLKDGLVSEQGSYQELVASKGAFADFLIEYMIGDEESDEIGDIMVELEQTIGAEKFKEFARQVSRKESVDENRKERKTTLRQQSSASPGTRFTNFQELF